MIHLSSDAIHGQGGPWAVSGRPTQANRLRRIPKASEFFSGRTWPVTLVPLNMLTSSKERPYVDTNSARARFEERFPELQNKARAYFADYKPEAKDEAVANSLFLTWHHFTGLIKNGKADDQLLTSTFYYSCRQTRSGRMMRTVKASKSRELWDHALKGGHAVVTALISTPTSPSVTPCRISWPSGSTPRLGSTRSLRTNVNGLSTWPTATARRNWRTAGRSRHPPCHCTAGN